VPSIHMWARSPRRPRHVDAERDVKSLWVNHARLKVASQAEHVKLPSLRGHNASLKDSRPGGPATSRSALRWRDFCAPFKLVDIPFPKGPPPSRQRGAGRLVAGYLLKGLHVRIAVYPFFPYVRARGATRLVSTGP
jgi:hypothetical protein